jgi:hypothetical protein
LVDGIGGVGAMAFLTHGSECLIDENRTPFDWRAILWFTILQAGCGDHPFRESEPLDIDL